MQAKKIKKQEKKKNAEEKINKMATLSQNVVFVRRVLNIYNYVEYVDIIYTLLFNVFKQI